MTRIRPPNRLAGQCEKIKVGGFAVFLHTDREARPDGSLGPVVQISISSQRRIGSDYDGLMQELTSAINKELQVRALKPPAPALP